MEIGLLYDYLAELETLDHYLTDCYVNGSAPDLAICRMLTGMTIAKVSYYGKKYKFEIDEDPYLPAGCVDFVVHSTAEKATA